MIDYRRILGYNIMFNLITNMVSQARVAELADALDLGSSGFTVGVRIPPLAPDKFFYRITHPVRVARA